MTFLCSGMAPWGGFLLNCFIAITLVPLKLLAPLVQWNFKRIVRNCAETKEKEQFEKVEEHIKNTGSVRPKRTNFEKRTDESDQ